MPDTSHIPDVEIGKLIRSEYGFRVCCGRCNTALGIPYQEKARELADAVRILENMGWVKTREKGWICKECNRKHSKRKPLPVSRYRRGLR